MFLVELYYYYTTINCLLTIFVQNYYAHPIYYTLCK